MITKYDSEVEESLARGGTYEINGTNAVTSKQFWGFSASDGAVIDTIKGVALKTAVTTLATITAAEVDISAIVTNDLSKGLLSGVLYRADGYVITYVKLTSGSLHCYKLINQITT